jgi:hypothetical protein
MHGLPRCPSLSKGLMPFLAALILTFTPSPIPAEPTRGGTLKLITQKDVVPFSAPVLWNVWLDKQ